MALPQIKKGNKLPLPSWTFWCDAIKCSVRAFHRSGLNHAILVPLPLPASRTFLLHHSYVPTHSLQSALSPLPPSLSLSLWLSFCRHCCIAAVRSHNAHSVPKGPSRPYGSSLVNMNSTLSLSIYLHGAHKVIPGYIEIQWFFLPAAKQSGLGEYFTQSLVIFLRFIMFALMTSDKCVTLSLLYSTNTNNFNN